jgi:flavin reductase (DIM6/NTAB) family NADH-FMN oxidoreductase RutF
VSPPDEPAPPRSSLRYGNPWADPEAERDPVRQARARLPAPVTIWTAGDEEPAGLTVSSLLLAQGEPGQLLGLIGPDTDFAETIERTGVFVVHLLTDSPEHRRLAQHFAGTLGADPDLLRVDRSDHGPRLRHAPDQLACRLRSRRPCGWSELVEADIDDVRLATPPSSRPGLLWYRGAFRPWAGPGGGQPGP